MTAVTTLRIEMLKFYENLYGSRDDFRDPSGWVCHYAKNYVQTIRTADIRWFVEETLKRIKADSKHLKRESVNLIVEGIKRYYKYTIDDECIAFVIKSKTEMNKDDENGGFLYKLFKNAVNSFKRNYNHTLETIKLK